MKNLSILIDILKGSRVFIQTHNYPDPDAIASAFGLQKLLEHFDISSTICYDGSAEKLSAITMLGNFSIKIVSCHDIPDMCGNDKIVIVDAQRRNSNVTELAGNEVACIDHHPTLIPCEYLYSDVTITGACASIIAQYYFQNGINPEKDVASALVYGIKMDTADFTRGVTLLDVDMYAKLFPLADNGLLDRMKINTMEFADLKAYGCAIENIRVYGNVGYAFIPFECPDALIAMISDFILALDIIEFSVVYAVRGSGYKFSVRSELPELHAGHIVLNALSSFGSGGGHARMAGGFAEASSFSNGGQMLDYEIRTAFEKAIEKEKKEYFQQQSEADNR